MGLEGTIGLIARVPSQERWVRFQFPVDSKDNREWSQVDVESSGVEHLRNQAAVGQSYFVTNAVFSST